MPLVILIGYNGIPESLSANDTHDTFGVWYDIMHGSIALYMMSLYAKYKENAFLWIAIGIVGILAADMYNYYFIHLVITLLTMLLGLFTVSYIAHSYNFKKRLWQSIFITLIVSATHITDFFYLGEWLLMGFIGFRFTKKDLEWYDL
jgi:hypothetical protein